MRLAALLATLMSLGLAGCTLIDQTTFDKHAADTPVIPAAPVAATGPKLVGPPPLLVIAAAETGYREALAGAVSAARARKPGVLFDVVEMQPADLAVDAPLGAAARDVARAIVAQGVPVGQVRLAARPEMGVKAGEVRVYVR